MAVLQLQNICLVFLIIESLTCFAFENFEKESSVTYADEMKNLHQSFRVLESLFHNVQQTPEYNIYVSSQDALNRALQSGNIEDIRATLSKVISDSELLDEIDTSLKSIYALIPNRGTDGGHLTEIQDLSTFLSSLKEYYGMYLGRSTGNSSSDDVVIALWMQRLPVHITDQYRIIQKDLLRAAVMQNFTDLSPDQYASIPGALLRVLPVTFDLLTHAQIVAAVRSHPNDVYLRYRVAEAVRKANRHEATEFILFVNSTDALMSVLAEDTDEAIGKYLATSLEEGFNSHLIPFLKKQDLLNLPEPVAKNIINTQGGVFSKFINPPTNVRRIWFTFATQDNILGPLENWDSNLLQKNIQLLLGATARQLRHLHRSIVVDNLSSFGLQSFTLPQARAILNIIFQDGGEELRRAEALELLHLYRYMTPGQVARIEDLDKVHEALTNYLFLSSRQLESMMVTLKLISSELPATSPDTATWTLEDVQRQDALLMIRRLSELKKIPSTSVSLNISTKYLSPAQKRVLFSKLNEANTTNNVSLLGNYFDVLPISVLEEQPLEELSNVVSLPDVRAAVVLQKVLEAPMSMLSKTPQLLYKSQFLWRFLPHVWLDEHTSDIGGSLQTRDINGEEILYNLPRKPLQTMFTYIRNLALSRVRNGVLYLDKLLESAESVFGPKLGHILTLGVSCSDVTRLEVYDVIPLAGIYREQWKLLQRNRKYKELSVMPPDLVMCFGKRIMEQFMMTVITKRQKDVTRNRRQVKVNDVLLKESFVNVEIPEVRTIGGVYFLDMPLSTLSYMKPDVQFAALRQVGEVGAAELIFWTSPSHLSKLAATFVKAINKSLAKKLFLSDLNLLGNLVGYLPADVIKRIDGDSLRQFIESRDGYGDSLVCVDSRMRKNLEEKILQVFGSPDEWDEGVLFYLGDQLSILSMPTLYKIQKGQLTRMAEILLHRSTLLKEYDHQIGEGTNTFVETCAERLGVEEGDLYRESVMSFMSLLRQSARLHNWEFNTGRNSRDTGPQWARNKRAARAKRQEKKKQRCPRAISEVELEFRMSPVFDSDVFDEIQTELNQLTGWVLTFLYGGDKSSLLSDAGHFSDPLQLFNHWTLLATQLPHRQQSVFSNILATLQEEVQRTVKTAKLRRDVGAGRKIRNRRDKSGFVEVGEETFSYQEIREFIDHLRSDPEKLQQLHSDMQKFFHLVDTQSSPLRPRHGEVREMSEKFWREQFEVYNRTVELLVDVRNEIKERVLRNLVQEAIADSETRKQLVSYMKEFTDLLQSVGEVPASWDVDDVADIVEGHLQERREHDAEVFRENLEEIFVKVKEVLEKTKISVESSGERQRRSRRTRRNDDSKMKVLDDADETPTDTSTIRTTVESKTNKIDSQNANEDVTDTSTINTTVEPNTNKIDSQNANEDVTYTTTEVTTTNSVIEEFAEDLEDEVSATENMTSSGNLTITASENSATANEDASDTDFSADDDPNRPVDSGGPVVPDGLGDIETNGISSTGDDDRVSNTTGVVKVGYESPLTCADLRAAAPALLTVTMEEISMMDTDELSDCMELLGGVQWPKQMRNFIWEILKEKIYNFPTTDNSTELDNTTLSWDITNMAADLPHDVTRNNRSMDVFLYNEDILQLGFLVSAFTVDDIRRLNITLSDGLEGVAVLGQQAWDENRADLLLQKLTQGSVWPRQLSLPEIAAFGSLICHLPKDDIRVTLQDSHSFHLAATFISGWQHCRPESLQALATVASSDVGYGSSHNWNRQDVAALGIIVTGLSVAELSNLGNVHDEESVSGLTPAAAMLLPTEKLQALSLNQLASLPLHTVMALSPRQTDELDDKQRRALRSTGADIPEPNSGHSDTKNTTTEPSNSSGPRINSMSFIILLVLNITNNFVYS